MKGMKFLGFLLLGLILAVSPVLAGGGQDAGGGALELWTMFTGADGTTFTEMVETYNARNPTLRVNHMPITAEELYLRLQLSVSSGQGIPDMAVNHVERIALFQEQGRILNLAPYLPNSPVRRENYNQRAWGMTQIGGGQYGIPLDVHSFILWVNWDLYERYGVTDLDDGILTWDEVRATAQRLQAMGSSTIPFGLTWLRPMFLASYAQLGGTLSADGINPNFDSPAAQRVLNNYLDLVRSGFTQQQGEDTWRLFLGGDMLYVPEGIWMFNDVRTSGLNIRAFDFPVFDTNVRRNWTSSHQFTIPMRRNFDNNRIAASLEFIHWVGENSLAWAHAGQVPAHVGGQRGDFHTLPQSFLAAQNQELAIFGYKYYGYAVESLDIVLGDMMFGNIDIMTGLRQAVQETRDRIEHSR
jgi:multiple sugar transport system substrate-binding protein